MESGAGVGEELAGVGDGAMLRYFGRRCCAGALAGLRCAAGVGAGFGRAPLELALESEPVGAGWSVGVRVVAKRGA